MGTTAPPTYASLRPQTTQGGPAWRGRSVHSDLLSKIQGGGRLREGGRSRGEDGTSKIRTGPLRWGILGVWGMLSRHVLRGSARGGSWRLPARRVGRAGGAPGARGARYG